MLKEINNMTRVPEMAPVHLLVIDDDPAFAQFSKDVLAQEGCEILAAVDAEEGLDIVRRVHPRIIVVDSEMARIGGLEILRRILDIDPGADVIVIAEHDSTESAVEAIQEGAADYLIKPVSTVVLRQRVAWLAAEARNRRRSLQLEHELLDTIQFEEMVSQSPLMWEVFVRIRRVAPHFQSVLVSGATGTGKELVARALHRLSRSQEGVFAAQNCSALVETLLESQLFGHVKGAFTGAVQDKKGLFEHANGGTVFLDEIGEMPLPMQAKLLRVLQSREIQRVGSPSTRKVDVRVIAATNKDLRRMVKENRFREDLFYRLCMVEIKLPPLVERKEDVRLLARHFLRRFAKEYEKPISGMTRRTHVLLARYSWPGNVRELENTIGHACMMARDSIIDVHDLPEHLQIPQRLVSEDNTMLPLEEVVQRYARRVLQQVGGNKVLAAQILEVSRSTLYRLLHEAETSVSKSGKGTA